MEILSLV